MNHKGKVLQLVQAQPLQVNKFLAMSLFRVENLGGSAKTTGYPINHFVGSDIKKLILLDNKFHGKDNLKTLGLIEHEIKEVINPCLASTEVSEPMKEHLEAKKKSLEIFKTV